MGAGCRRGWRFIFVGTQWNGWLLGKMRSAWIYALFFCPYQTVKCRDAPNKLETKQNYSLEVKGWGNKSPLGSLVQLWLSEWGGAVAHCVEWWIAHRHLSLTCSAAEVLWLSCVACLSVGLSCRIVFRQVCCQFSRVPLHFHWWRLPPTAYVSFCSFLQFFKITSFHSLQFPLLK